MRVLKLLALFALFGLPVNAQNNRVRAGSASYTDSTGAVWSADTGLFAGATQMSGCAPSATVTGTPDPGLYKAMRYGSAQNNEMTYTLQLPNGTYAVNLYEAETCNMPVGSRVFSVQAQGVTVITNLDITQQAGGMNKALVLTFTSTVNNGTLVIKFIHNVNNPIFYAVSATLAQDITPPAVVISTPAVGTFQTPQSVQVQATDNIGVTKVSATLDGADMGTPVQAGTLYTFSQDVTKIPVGTHTIIATALDAAGNKGTNTMSFSIAATVALIAVPTQHRVALNWIPGVNTPTTSPAVTYNVYRRLVGGNYGLPIASGVSQTNYVDLTVVAATAYDYAVTGVNSTGESAMSNEVQVTIPQ